MQYFNVLQEIGEALNASLETNTLFKIVLDKCLKFTHSDTGSLILLMPNKTLEIKYQIGFAEGTKKNVKLKIGEGVTGMSVKERRPLLVNDVSKFAGYVPIDKRIRSEIAVPIIYKQKVLGVLNVDSRKVKNYRPEDLELMTVVGSNLGLVLTNLGYIDELRLKVFHDEILLDINRSLSSSMDLTRTMKNSLKILKQSGKFARGILFLRKKSANAFTPHDHFGFTQRHLQGSQIIQGEGVLGMLLKKAEPLAFRNKSESMWHLLRGNLENDHGG